MNAIPARHALEQRKPGLREIATKLAPAAPLEEIATSTEDCRGKGSGWVFLSWRVTLKVPHGTGAAQLGRARELFGQAGYRMGSEYLDYKVGPEILWVSSSDDSQLHAIGYRDSARLDLILDGPCGPPGDPDSASPT